MPIKSEPNEQSRIQNSMLKWRKMDETASLLGRGLGRKELLSRVAKDVGLSIRKVECALKKHAILLAR